MDTARATLQLYGLRDYRDGGQHGSDVILLAAEMSDSAIEQALADIAADRERIAEWRRFVSRTNWGEGPLAGLMRRDANVMVDHMQEILDTRERELLCERSKRCGNAGNVGRTVNSSLPCVLS